MCEVLDTGSCVSDLGKLGDNNEPPIVETVVYILPEGDDICVVVNIRQACTVSRHIVVLVPNSLLLWYDMSVFDSKVAIGNTTGSSSRGGGDWRPEIRATILTEAFMWKLIILEARVNRIQSCKT